MRLITTLLLSSLTLLAHPAVAAPAAICHGEPQIARILSLMSQRLDLAEAVARHKWNRHVAIEDSAREQLIVTKLTGQAVAQGLPADWSEAFFRAQINASKMRQQQLFQDWQRDHATSFPDVPDLDTQTRPKLYALMSELINALGKAWQPLQQPGCQPVLERLVKDGYAKPEYGVASAPLFTIPIVP